ncbi:MAG TPA: hypothetical protein DDW34_04130, partial [Clostridium sp.]|nr:hypothetical protein [Clostridium sp.]
MDMILLDRFYRNLNVISLMNIKIGGNCMPGVQCLCKNQKKEEIVNNIEIKTSSASFQFYPITLDKKQLIESYTKPWGAECSDLSFTNMFIWGTDGKMEYAEKDNVLYIKLDFKRVPIYFWAPIPKHGENVNYRKAVYDAIEYMKKVGVEPTIRSVSSPFY